jgi:hypothetical protein
MSGTRKWREQFLSRKWFIVTEQVAYKKINRTKSVELRNIGKYLYKLNVNGRIKPVIHTCK